MKSANIDSDKNQQTYQQLLRNSLEKFRQLKLQIKVLPKSSSNQIVELSPLKPTEKFDLKIKLTAVAAKNRANYALLDFLAEELQLPLYCLEFHSGAKSRHKIILVQLP